MLFQNAKIQDLNVIHNSEDAVTRAETVVSECKDTRFECNSQPWTDWQEAVYVVSECKDTRFECNSQRTNSPGAIVLSCFRMQRYKI